MMKKDLLLNSLQIALMTIDKLEKELINDDRK